MRYLGGIRDLAGLRCRCVVDEAGDDPCWHWRRGDGSVPRRGVTNDVVAWVHGIGKMTATRASWYFSRGQLVQGRKYVIVRRCESWDCCAPTHLRKMTRGDHGSMLVGLGRSSSVAKVAAARATAASRATVTPELLQWLLESPQGSTDIGHALGVTRYRVAALRRRARETMAKSSVFAWRPQ